MYGGLAKRNPPLRAHKNKAGYAFANPPYDS